MKPPQQALKAYHSIPLLFFRYITRLTSGKAKIHRVITLSQNGVVYLNDNEGKTTRTFHPKQILCCTQMTDNTSIVLNLAGGAAEPDLFIFFEASKVVSTEADRAKTNPIEATLPYFIELLLYFNADMSLKYERDLPEGQTVPMNLKKDKSAKREALLTSGVHGYVRQARQQAASAQQQKETVAQNEQQQLNDTQLLLDPAPSTLNKSNDAAFGEMVAFSPGGSQAPTPEESHLVPPPGASTATAPGGQTSRVTSDLSSSNNCSRNTALLRDHCRKGISGATVTHTLLESAVTADLDSPLGILEPPSSMKIDSHLVNQSFLFLRLVDLLPASSGVSPPASAFNVSRSSTNYNHLVVVGPMGTLTIYQGAKVAAQLSLQNLAKVTTTNYEPGVYTVRLTPGGNGGNCSTPTFVFVEEKDNEASGTLLYFFDVCKTFCSRVAIEPVADAKADIHGGNKALNVLAAPPHQRSQSETTTLLSASGRSGGGGKSPARTPNNSFGSEAQGLGPGNFLKENQQQQQQQQQQHPQPQQQQQQQQSSAAAVEQAQRELLLQKALRRNNELKEAIRKQENSLASIDHEICVANAKLQASFKPLSATQLHNLTLLVMRACEAGAAKSHGML